MISCINCTGIAIITSLILLFSPNDKKNENENRPSSILDRPKYMLNKYIKSFKYVIWNSINFVAMSVSSFYALYYINIPIFLAVRRCQSVFVVIIYLFICWSHKIKAKIVISSLICTLSTLICIYEDWENGNIYGYLALITLNSTSVIFLEYSKYLMEKI